MEDFNQKEKTHTEGESDFRPWGDLFPEALALIFQTLMLQELFKVIPRVCKSWRKAVEGPYCWQRIDIVDWSSSRSKRDRRYKIDKMLNTLIPRSSGSLRELSVAFLDDDQLVFIANQAGTLQSLTLSRCTVNDSIIEQVASKFSSVTSLDLRNCKFSTKALRVIGENFKMLTSLTWTVDQPEFYDKWWEGPPSIEGDKARAIAQTMPKLRHLVISHLDFGTRHALEILSSCSELEVFNIEGCWSVNRKLLLKKYPDVKLLGPGVRPEEEIEDDHYNRDPWWMKHLSPYSWMDDSWMDDPPPYYYEEEDDGSWVIELDHRARG